MKIFSFLSNFPITWYIIAALFASLSLSVWFNKHQSEQIGGLKAAQASYVSALESSQNQLENKDLSCKIDDKSAAELEAEKSSIQSKSNDIEKEILNLKSSQPEPLPKAVKPSNEIITNEIIYLPDDGPLSPSLRLLLKKSYCTAEPTDSSCSP